MNGRRRWRAALLAIVLLAVALLWWVGDEDPGPGEEALAEAALSSAGVVVPAAPLATLPGPARDDLTGSVPPRLEQAPPPALDHPFEYDLELIVRDAFGVPSPDALVFAGPLGCGLSRWPEATGDDGRARLHWQGKRNAMTLRLAVVAAGVLQPQRLVELDAGRPRTLALVVTGRPQDDEALAALRRRTPDGLFEDARRVRRAKRRQDLDALCGRHLRLFSANDCTACHDPSSLASYSMLARAAVARPVLHEAAWFSDLWPTPVADEEGNDRQHRLADSRRRAAGHGSHGATGAAHGTVADASGKVIAGVPVAALAGERLLGVAWTDAEGRWQLGSIPHGPVMLRAGGGEAGDASTEVGIGAAPMQWNCQLTVQNAVHGQALDEQGAVLANWRIEFESIGGPFADLAFVDPAGRFTLPGIPGPGLCYLWSAEGRRRLPIGIGTAVLPDTGTVTLRLDPALPAGSQLRLRPALPREAMGGAVEATIAQLATGRVASLHASTFDGRFEADGLCPGEYRVEVAAPRFGVVDAGVVVADGHGPIDLGNIVFSPRGRLRFLTPELEPSPLAGEHEFCRRLTDVDVRTPYERAGDQVLLPPGTYLLLWRNDKGRHVVAFHVAAGATTEVIVNTR
ncbi:MAG: carboxypeptidase regulatory-like domain-containing protein [Planctomycetes bacterium]|nr:carboxypeptidase regulatory-like domain-containing protein [Planctomycetota bacterium]